VLRAQRGIAGRAGDGKKRGRTFSRQDRDRLRTKEGIVGRTVLITGASSGIGDACARHLVSLGHKVYGAQRSRIEPGGAFRSVVMDVTDDDSVRRGVGEVLAAEGRIDAVVNNAGYALMGSIEDSTIDEARAQMETNFFGVLRVCREVTPILRRQGSGHIINISSLAGILGLPFSGLYSASKFAVEGLTESLRHELRPFGIRVAMIEPGDIRTNLPANRRMASGADAGSAYAAMFDKVKTAQDKDEAAAPGPEMVAKKVAGLLEDPNPSLRHVVGMTGQTIVVPAKRLLPQSLFERVLRTALGI
jgi:NAD(P)-dependent dehydrogenase (short-subunit alcohol dehydrogenase family)